MTVYAAPREGLHRRGFVHLDDDHERTITILGERIVPHGDDDLPWERLGDVDGVYFTGGDVGALEQARRARKVVATPRARTTRCARLGVSSTRSCDRPWTPASSTPRSALDPAPDIVVSTAGKEGGEWVGEDRTSGRWQAAQLPGPPQDAYGAGDSFAAGLTYGLAAGMAIDAGRSLPAGAYKLAGRAAYDGQLTAADL